MKLFKKSILFFFGIFILVTITFYSCKKKQTEPVEGSSEYYSSMKDFYIKNGVTKQTFTINAVNGGSFVSVKGTTVNIPANAFKDSVGNLITGVINFEFKDIYKKSDMVLSDMPTNCDIGAMKSAGEFYLNAYNNVTSVIATKTITVIQPSNGPFDSGMQALAVIRPDTAQKIIWNAPCGAFSCATGTAYYAPNYHYYIYSGAFSTDPAYLHWFNTDNPDAFSAYPQTTLTVINSDISIQADVFLIFSTVNSALQIYNSTGYKYLYAPVGLKASIVAAGLKDGKLCASIIPITISSNQTVTLDLKLMNTFDFVNALKALD